MRRTAMTAGVTAVLLAAAHAVPAIADPDPQPAVTAADLPRLQAELARVTAQAQVLADKLDQAAAQDGGLRVALERLADQHDQAQATLDARARLVYMHSAPDPLGALNAELTSPG